MPYEMHRIFCATPFDLEEERLAFHSVMAEFNDASAMKRGVLLVTVSLVPHFTDKRIYQHAINDNIRACRYYIQVLEDSWGPPQRDLERDYPFALKCVADPELPMREVVSFFKKPLLPHKVDASVAELKRSLGAQEYEDIEDFKRQLRAVLPAWLESIRPASTDAPTLSSASAGPE